MYTAYITIPVRDKNAIGLLLHSVIYCSMVSDDLTVCLRRSWMLYVLCI